MSDVQDFAEQHRHRACEVLGPHAGAEIAALGGVTWEPRRPQEIPGDPRRPHEVEAAPLESPEWGAPALLQWFSIDFDGISMAVAQGVQESIESLLPRNH